MPAEILILTTGGTIDKVYFDAKSNYRIGNPQITEILQHVGVSVPYVIKTLLAKDSMELTEQDRDCIRDGVCQATQRCILITHGTDTMITTARHLQPVRDKTVVLVGALMPARFKSSDAEFNIGFALAAVQILPNGVYLAMNGQIFNPEEVQKNIAANRFEPV
ncbi:MAG: asparaginase domain-containing protein [Bacteroidetes bacterium]|nr:asparaginase domain-containing protein [Bacteroidota bacterium]